MLRVIGFTTKTTKKFHKEHEEIFVAARVPLVVAFLKRLISETELTEQTDWQFTHQLLSVYPIREAIR